MSAHVTATADPSRGALPHGCSEQICLSANPEWHTPALSSFEQMSAQRAARLRTWLATGAGAAAVAYVAYRAYHSQSASQLGRLCTTLTCWSAALASSGSVAAQVSSDVHAFLSSDSDEVPRSFRQLTKLLQCQEVQDTLTCTATAVWRGVAAASSTSGAEGGSSMHAALDTFLEAVLSDRGRSLVGLAVDIATKNATGTFCEFLERMHQNQAAGQNDIVEGDTMDASELNGGPQQMPPMLRAIMAMLGSAQGERLITLLITKSMKTVVCTYVDATAGVNVYDDMLASVSKKEHREAVTEIMSRVTAAFCREVATAYRSGAQQKHTRGPGASGSPAAGQFLSASSASSSSGSVISLSGHTEGQARGCSGSATGGGSLPDQAQNMAGVQLVCEVGGMGMRRLSLDGPLRGPGLLAGVVGQPSMPLNYKGHARGQEQRPVVAASASSAVSNEWLKPLVELVRERDVRSLVLEVVGSATREATKGTWEALFGPLGGEGAEGRGRGVLVGMMQHRLAVLFTVAIALAMFVLLPALRNVGSA